MSGMFSCIGGKNPLKRSKKKKNGKGPKDKKNKQKNETVEEKEEGRPESPPTVEECKEPPITELKVNIEEANKKDTVVEDPDSQDTKEPVSPLIKELQAKFLKMDKQKIEGESSQDSQLENKSLDKAQEGEGEKHNLPKNFAKNVPTGATHESDTELCLLRTRISQIEKENEQFREVIDQLKEKEKAIQREASDSRVQGEILKDKYEEIRMQKEALQDELEQCKKENAAMLERDEHDGCHVELGKRIGNEDTKGTEEILEAIGQLERVCSAFEPGIEKVEKIEMADSVADNETEKLKTRLTKVEDARSELGEEVVKNLKILQELECRIIAIEVTKDSEAVTGQAISDNVVKRLSNAEENQTALTKEVGKLTHSYSEMEIRLAQIEEEKDHLNTQVQSALADNEQLRQTIENLSESLKQKEIALQGTIKDSTERNGEVETLRSQCKTKDGELKDMLMQCEDLKAAVNEERKKHKELLEKYEEIDKELKSHKESPSLNHEELESLKSQCQNRQTEIIEEQKRSQQFQKELSDYSVKYKDMADRYDKLQAQLKNGETWGNVAATNGVDCSTPSQVAERYVTELYKDKWNAAYEKLTTVCKRDEKKSLQILMDFCTEAYLHCRRTARQQIDMLWSLLTNPSASHLRGGISRRTSASKLPSLDSIPNTLKAAVMDFRKRPSKQFVDNLYDDFLTQIDFEKSRHLRNVHERDVNEIAPYINKCLEVSWEMVVQDPPMYLQFKVRHGSEVDTGKFEFYGHSGHKIDYLVWPALLRDENGTLLQKGVIQAVAEKP